VLGQGVGLTFLLCNDVFYNIDSVACVISGTSVTAKNILPAPIKTSSASDCQIACQNLLACQVIIVSIFLFKF
jgi:hypothetical protein